MKRAYDEPETGQDALALQNMDVPPLGPPPPPVPSDRRLKRDIELLTQLADGTKLYSFRYLWSETVHVGLMAQDLLDDPQHARAVSKLPNGYFAVDYRRLGLQMATLEEWNASGVDTVTYKVSANHAGKTQAA